MRVLGLDSGIASIGWALIETEDGVSGNTADGNIIGAGTWMFDAPEEQSQNGTKLKSELRRAFRGQRRVTRRRRQRMNEVRRILHRHGLLSSAGGDALKQPGLDPWRLRAEGLERLLTPAEFAVALGHIARHRGFKSNSKGAKPTNAADETSKMKKEMEGAREKLARYEGSPARMMTEDDSFVLRATKMNGVSKAENHSQKGWDVVRRFRNREGDYSRSLLRDDLAAEVRALFRAQARLQSAFATEQLEAEFTDVAFFQRPLQDSERLVGSCPFEPTEKRSPKRGYSFELFRFLARLNHLTLQEGRDERTLTTVEVRAAAAQFGATAKFTFAALRKKLMLPDTAFFIGVKREEESKLDVVARSGEAAAGTARLRRVIVEALGELAWGSLLNAPGRLDKIAEIITFRSDLGRIRQGLDEAGFDPSLTETIVKACGDGAHGSEVRLTGFLADFALT
jgi:CRISPR-associated endonuclease Csn1